MKVLVTGAAGWLGRHLVPSLRAAGHEPVGLDVVASPWTDVQASVADRPALEAVFAAHEFTAVIHAGALHKPDIARYPQQAFIDVNVSGTLALLELACEKPVTRFVFTSTTSLMISQKIRAEASDAAVWLDEDHAPLEPRNIYGVTKLAAENLCRQHHLERGLGVTILRTSRFFPEEDDTIDGISGENLKANELLHRRGSVQDMARAHLAALETGAPGGFGLYIVSAPPPFERDDCHALKKDAASVVRDHFPRAEELYAKTGWQLPETIGRVYDGRRICRDLGFDYSLTFADLLAVLDRGKPSPLIHDPAYTSPLVAGGDKPV